MYGEKEAKLRDLVVFLETELLTALDSQEQGSKIHLFDHSSRHYSMKCRNLIMDLQQHNIADANITTIIQDFAYAFDLNIDLTKLPSLRTIGRIGQEGGIVAHVQVGRAITAPRNQGALGGFHDGSTLGQDKLMVYGVVFFLPSFP